MDRLQTIVNDIIEGNTAAKLQALVQLSVAIALFISDLESAAQIALVVQLIERALVEVGHQAPSIALVDLKQIACSLEGLHVQCSMVYCTYAGTLVESALPPSMLAFNCYCTCQFASPSMPVGLATHLVRYVKERLVGATIGSLVNIAALVQTTGFRGDHWLQQIATQVTLTYRGHIIDSAAELSALIWRPTIEDCYTGFAASGVHRHLIFRLALAGVEKVPQLSTIGDHNEEEEIGQSIVPAAPRIASEIAQVRLTLPHGVEAIVTHE
ncbi:hypothetical protein AK812_SmicGene15223 [Symbiodinium microadriaticum]|uniref:Uncharacterized protein n=1 Tax=Symbiodinium microadriaticum TaxID=2951 RepID=A0A1Q9E3J8_SYMMI|nr:hypothetical protein AK812_SmicGene15223 [Symbiodinium microadriaticum]